LKEVINRFDVNNSYLLGISPVNASANYSMTRELQSTLEASKVECPAMRNHIPLTTHGTQRAVGLFMSIFSVNGHTMSCDAHERD